MIRTISRFAVLVAGVVVSGSIASAGSENSFPFGSELMFDQAPMHGSKRVPMIEIEDNGATSIDLWCASAKAQATVGDGSITIIPGEVEANAQCDRSVKRATPVCWRSSRKSRTGGAPEKSSSCWAQRRCASG
jgi:hypothetical protein